MIRIILNIKEFSPFLQTISGEVVVDWIDYIQITEQVKPILTCEFDAKPNQMGYRNAKSCDAALFYALKPQMDIMINSYRRGMTLAPHDFSWVEETKNKSFNIWKAEKERQYEASDEFQHEDYKKS